MPREGIEDRARHLVAGAMRSVLSPSGTGSSRPHRPLTPQGDAGLFGPDSVAWKVHSDIATLIGGLRALLYQTLHPLAMAGVADHSDYRHDPWGRLARTGDFVARTTYGTTEEAMAAIATVRRVHRRVVGVAPDGRSYSANDPELLSWVHATEVDSFLSAHTRYAGRLSRADRDRYVSEMAVVGELLGVVRAPRTVRELVSYLNAVPGLRAGHQAREAVRFLLFPPMSVPARLPYGVVVAAAVDLLPLRARLHLRLPVVPGVGPMVVRPAAQGLFTTLRWALGPSPVLATAESRTH